MQWIVILGLAFFIVRFQLVRRLVLGGIILLVGATIGLMTEPEESDGKPSPTQSCQTDWMLCQTNAEFAHSPAYAEVRSACVEEVKKQAKFGLPMWLASPFSQYFDGIPDHEGDLIGMGLSYLIDPDVKLLTRRGTWVKAKVFCLYKLGPQQVAGIHSDHDELLRRPGIEKTPWRE